MTANTNLFTLFASGIAAGGIVFLMSYAFIRKKGFNTMKQIVNFDELFDFIERNTEEYAMCDDCESLISAVVTYAEYAVRKKYEGNDE